MNEIPEYILAFAYLGFASSLIAFIPLYTKKLKITYIIPLLILGMGLYFVGAPLPWPKIQWEFTNAKIISEVIVIISLMTAGLKIGVNYSWRDWKKPLSLIVITMPLFMAAIFVISYYIFDLNGPVSLLLAAVLAPTDPVLASDVQLEEHQDEKKRNVGLKYTLTAEAGMNDGVAFPFVFFAIIWSQSTSLEAIDWVHFLEYYVIYKLIVGLLIGALIGFIYSYLIHKHNDKQTYKILGGFIAVALTFFSYGIAEFAHAYGFLSVFATGIFLQYYQKRNAKERVEGKMLDFVEETEKLMVVIWTIFFGGAVMSGILSYTNFKGILFSLAIVLLLRPIFGYLAMLTTDFSKAKKWAISFLGVRGIGSYFYLSFALIHGEFKEYSQLFGIISYVVLFSIIIHGFTSLRVIDYFNKKEGIDQEPVQDNISIK